jgi:hypothetical protein
MPDMRRITGLALFFFAFTWNGRCQINMQDSTVQVIGYWEKNEKQSYDISLFKYKLEGKDTTSRQIIRYEAEVTVLDANDKSYTIEWFYRNFRCTGGDVIMQKLSSAAQDLKVVIRSDEMGAFKEVVNWKEVRDYIERSVASLRTEYKNAPQTDELLKQQLNMFTTKEAIQTAAIRDIHQFYTYHGGKYKLGEQLSGKQKVPNLLGVEPFDTDITVRLDEINVKEGNSIIRMSQVVDSKQLTDASYEYLKKVSKTIESKPPKREEMPDVVNETQTASRIHASSGWVIYSIETKETVADRITSIEERTIEIK